MSSFPDLLSPSHPSLEHNHHIKALIFAQTIRYLIKKSEDGINSAAGQEGYSGIPIELNRMANELYHHACHLINGVPHRISNIAPDLLCLVHDDLRAHIDLLLQAVFKIEVQQEHQKFSELEI